MFSRVYVFVLCRIQIMSICLSDLTESIINSFDCVGRKELLALRRKEEVQAEQRRTLGNWRAGSCRWRVNSHTRCSHGISVSPCDLLWKSHSHLYITLFKRPNSVVFFFPCGTDYIWLIMSKQEIEAQRICDMEINLIWFGFVHFYMPSRLSMHIVTHGNTHSCHSWLFFPHQCNGDISLHLTPRVFWHQKYFGKKWLRLLFSSCLCQCK